MGFSKARFVLRRQTVSDPVRVQKHFLGAGILRVKWKEAGVGNAQEPINESELSEQMQAWKAFLPV